MKYQSVAVKAQGHKGVRGFGVLTMRTYDRRKDNRNMQATRMGHW